MQQTHSVLVLSDLPHRELITYAQFVESLGFDCFWYADERFYHEPYVGLAAVAMATTRIRLGPAVADPKSRHPALVAAAINSLNELSGGRSILGFGAGASGFHNLGIGRDRAALSMREGIEVIEQLLLGEPTTLHGETTYINAAAMLVSTQSVPISVAANSPLTLRLAGEKAESVMIPHCRSVDLLRHKMKYVAEGAEDAGRDELPRVIMRMDTSIADDSETAVRAAKRRLGRMLWQQYPNVRYLDILGLPMPKELARRFEEAGPFVYTFDLEVFDRFVDAIPDELLEPIALAGTKEEVAGQVNDLFDAGASEVCILPVPSNGRSDRDVVADYAEGLHLADHPRSATTRPG
jgi:5,10-methylenetetrahydromethanopterin reductase